MENYAACALQFACCGLRHSLPQAAAQAAAPGRSTRPQHQAVASKLQRTGHMVFYVCVRANTQHASEIAKNSVALLVEIQRKLKYVQLGAACGLRPAAKYEPALKVLKQYSNQSRAVARFYWWGGGKMGQYKFINRNFSAESRKIVLLIFKPFKMSKNSSY